MPTQDKIEAIRKACAIANPSILDLEFGCEIEWIGKGADIGKVIKIYRDNSNICVLFNGNDRTEYHKKETFDKNIKILGRDIHLADVLLAIYKQNPANKTNITLESDGQFIYKTYNPETRHGGVHWNLLKPMHLQEEAVIDFIYQLIK